jgi:tetratricopeptide (TPR) repeat protein
MTKRPKSERMRDDRRAKACRPGDAAAGGLADRLGIGLAHHRDGRLDDAAAVYSRILADMPRQPDALHLLGVVHHQRGDHRRAEDLITRAIAVDDGDAARHNNLGSVQLALGRPQSAAGSFRRALALNPAYAEAANNLGNALQLQGRADEAVDWYRRALEIRPSYAEASYNLGRARRALGDLEAAADSFRRAVAARGDYGKALRDLGETLGELGRTADAEAVLRRAVAAAPDDADSLAALAALLERSSALKPALEQAETALRRDPAHIRAALVAAKCLRRTGRASDAIDRLAAVDVAADAEARAVVGYELGACFDRLGRYGEAFRQFTLANAAILETEAARAIDRDEMPGLIRRLQARFTPDWVASWTPAPPATGAVPVFLLGFPRSGTTLLDQILDAHPALCSIEEKPTVDAIKRRVAAMPQGYPDQLSALSADDIVALRQLYGAEADRYRGDRPGALLVDKMPLNTIDVGLIHRLFPHAKILLSLRHPCDVVLSGFIQAFRPNASMIHFASLDGTARFYVQVMTLWRHYAAVLPLDVLTVRYEDLVADFPGQARRVLDFLGVPWDEAVLGYADHARARAIATPSYHQVVQPIYARSIGRWRSYRQDLEPILPVLAPLVAAFGYELDGAGG